MGGLSRTWNRVKKEARRTANHGKSLTGDLVGDTVGVAKSMGKGVLDGVGDVFGEISGANHAKSVAERKAGMEKKRMQDAVDAEKKAADDARAQQLANQANSGNSKVELGGKTKRGKSVGVSKGLGLLKGDTGVQV